MSRRRNDWSDDDDDDDDGEYVDSGSDGSSAEGAIRRAAAARGIAPPLNFGESARVAVPPRPRPPSDSDADDSDEVNEEEYVVPTRYPPAPAPAAHVSRAAAPASPAPSDGASPSPDATSASSSRRGSIDPLQYRPPPLALSSAGASPLASGRSSAAASPPDSPSAHSITSSSRHGSSSRGSGSGRSSKHRHHERQSSSMSSASAASTSSSSSRRQHERRHRSKKSSGSSALSVASPYDSSASSKNRISTLDEMGVSSLPDAAQMRRAQRASLDELESRNALPLLGFVFAYSVLVAVDFSIVFPSLYGYILSQGGHTGWYAGAFAAYTGAQICGAPLIHAWLRRRPIRGPLLASVLSVAVGNFLYSLLRTRVHNDTHLPDARHLPALVVGRAIAGFGSSLAVVSFAHVARVSPPEFVTSRVSALQVWETSARLAGPALGAVLVKAHFLFFGGAGGIGELNIGTWVVAWLAVALALAILPTYAQCYLDRQTDDVGALFFRRSAYDEELARTDLEQRSIAVRDAMLEPPPPPSRAHVGAMVLMFLALSASFWAFAAAAVPDRHTQAWTVLNHYLFFLFIGGVYVVTYALHAFLARPAHDDARVALAATVVMLAGTVALTNFGSHAAAGDSRSNHLPLWQLLLAAGLLVAGFCVGTLQLAAMFAHTIGIEQLESSQRLTALFTVVAVARLVGPVWGALAFNSSGLNLVAHTATGVLSLALVVGFLFLASSAVRAPSARRAEEALLMNAHPSSQPRTTYM